MATPISNTIISLTAIDGTDCLGDSRAVINNNTTTIGESISALSVQNTAISASIIDVQTTLNTTLTSNIVFSNSTLETPTTGLSVVDNFIVLLQTTYDALTVKRPTTLYFVVSS